MPPKPQPRKRNIVAHDLAKPKYRQRIVPDKRRTAEKRRLERERRQ